MNDLISRQAAIDSIMEEPSEARYPVFYAEKIRQLSPAQPEPRWIPVTEQLPTPNVFIRNIQEYYLIQNKYGDMLVACYDGEWEQIYNPECYINKNEVIAWMPLPKPYKRSEE